MNEPAPVSVRLPKLAVPEAATTTFPEVAVKWAFPPIVRLSEALSPKLIVVPVKLALPVTASVAAVPVPSVSAALLVSESDPAEDEFFSCVAESS